MEKKCFKCNETKQLTEFYKHKKMQDGTLNKCKECTKRDSAMVRHSNLEYYKEYDRKRASLPHRVKLREEITKKWKEDPELKKRNAELKRKWSINNSDKKAAHTITGNAIRDGRLIKNNCEICGESKVDAHHDDYTKPLEVRWLCRKHHAEHHKKERESKRKNK